MSTTIESSLPSDDGPSAACTGHRYWMAALLCASTVVALFSVGFLLGHYGIPGRGPATAGTPSEHAHQFGVFWEAWQQIEQKFYSTTPLHANSMTYGAIRGMLASLEDPFTSFAAPAQRQLEDNALQGDFGGIGASLALVDRWPTLVDVHIGSPAELAGLKAGDRLLAVDGFDVSGFSLDQVVSLIRGSLGAPVQLDVQRSEKWLSVTIARQRVELPSLNAQLIADGVGYVGVRLFSARTGEELATAIEQLGRQDADALVLDLRGNGGGLTGGAVDVLRRLLGHGIAFREKRRASEEQRHAIPFGEPVMEWPLAVLVDGGTASAAEIVAAAIRDYGRGVLIGQRTFGKGTVQGVYRLSDGSSVHITTAQWLSAGGYPIEGVGVAPDIVVHSAAIVKGEDPFLRRAVDYLQQKLGRVSVGNIDSIDSDQTGKVVV